MLNNLKIIIDFPWAVYILFLMLEKEEKEITTEIK